MPPRAPPAQGRQRSRRRQAAQPVQHTAFISLETVEAFAEARREHDSQTRVSVAIRTEAGITGPDYDKLPCARMGAVTKEAMNRILQEAQLDEEQKRQILATPLGDVRIRTRRCAVERAVFYYSVSVACTAEQAACITRGVERTGFLMLDLGRTSLVPAALHQGHDPRQHSYLVVVRTTAGAADCRAIYKTFVDQQAAVAWVAECDPCMGEAGMQVIAHYGCDMKPDLSWMRACSSHCYIVHVTGAHSFVRHLTSHGGVAIRPAADCPPEVLARIPQGIVLHGTRMVPRMPAARGAAGPAPSRARSARAPAGAGQPSGRATFATVAARPAAPPARAVGGAAGPRSASAAAAAPVRPAVPVVAGAGGSGAAAAAAAPPVSAAVAAGVVTDMVVDGEVAAGSGPSSAAGAAGRAAAASPATAGRSGVPLGMAVGLPSRVRPADASPGGSSSDEESPGLQQALVVRAPDPAAAPAAAGRRDSKRSKLASGFFLRSRG